LNDPLSGKSHFERHGGSIDRAPPAEEHHHRMQQGDIAELVYDCGLEGTASADRRFDFWFAPLLPRCCGA
jgi:hypothetical protein